MNTLFSIEPLLPSGFSYHADFIDPEEEKLLLETIKHTALHTFTFQGYDAKRKVASFGYDWNFDTQTLSEGKTVPPAYNWLIEKVASYLSIAKEEIVEMLVTEYPEGSVINWHRDAPAFDMIIGISLLADCLFKLRPYERKKQNRKATIAIPVARRSLYLMKATARTEWQHSIAPVKQTRYSITIRTLKATALKQYLEQS